MGWLLTCNAFALRCNHKVIQIENSYDMVLENCGEPKSRDSYSKQSCFINRINNVVNRGCASIQIDKLVYKNNGMTHTLTFEDKILKNIDSCRVC